LDDETLAAMKKLLAAWVDAQVRGDFDAYLALYNSARFEGVRRTASGVEKRLDYPAWKSDRKRLFARPQKVQADAPIFEPGTGTIAFVQRWQSGGRAEHGDKVFAVSRSEAGELNIVREEMRTSAHGWDDTKVEVIDGKALASPVTVRVAWVKRPDCTPTAMVGCERLLLTVTGANGDKREVGLYDEGSDRNPRLGPIAPESQGPVLFSEGWYWAGGGDYFRVVHDARGIAVKHRMTDEGSETTPGYDEPSVWPDERRIDLADGAHVIAK
jgi:hypothetical protein